MIDREKDREKVIAHVGMTETTIKCHEVERFENLMYDGCEPHWHCIHCDNYWPFHCYGKKDLEQMECPSRNDRLMIMQSMTDREVPEDRRAASWKE